MPKYLVEDNDIKSYTINETPLTNPGQSGDVLGVPGTWEDVDIDVTHVTEQKEDYGPVTGDKNAQIRLQLSKDMCVQKGILNITINTFSIDFTYLENNVRKSGRIEGVLNNPYTIQTYDNQGARYVRFEKKNIVRVKNAWSTIRITDVNFNGTSYTDIVRLNDNQTAIFKPQEVDDGQDRPDPGKGYFLHPVSATTYTGKTELSSVPVLTMTNTFKPNRKLTLKSVFNDETPDSASTNKITKIKYTLKDGTGKEITTPAVEKGDSGFPEMKVYVPDGNYTVYQTYYYLDGFGNVRSKTDSAGEFNAFQTASTFKPDGETEQSGGASVTNKQINKNTTITFTNTRKELPVTVMAKWERGADDPEPKEGSDLYENGIPYEMSYKVYSGSVSPISGIVKGPQWEKQHAGAEAPPSYSVDGSKTKLEVASTDINDRLKDYDTVVTRDDSDSTKVVFTITNTLKRGVITISKEWMLAFKEDTPDWVKIAITDQDGIAIDGSPFVLYESNNWKTSTVELPVGKTYTVAETAIDGTNMNDPDYTVSYAQDVEIPNPDYDPTVPGSQEFIMVPKTKDPDKVELTSKGATVAITNSKFICKIVDSEGTEHPFVSLNEALTWARANRTVNPSSYVDGKATIEMLVDYAIPRDDQLVIDQATDSIVITTADTSGGDFNFVPTFSESEGRREDDSLETAILRRKVSNTDSLFKITNGSAALSTSNIIIDGGNELQTALTTSSDGGLLKAESGALNVTQGTILRNSTAKNGGAIYIGTAGTLSVTGTTINDCAATTHGGAIYYNSANAVTISGLTINGHVNRESNKTNASERGGGIYMNAGTLSMSNSYLYNCTVPINNNQSDMGGAIYCNSSAIPEGGVTINVTGTTINGHYNGFDPTVLNARDGGGIYMEKGTLSLSGNSSVSDCYVYNKGGGIYAKNAATINNSTISGNKCTNDSTTGEQAVNVNRGGGIFFIAQGKMLTLESARVEENSAYRGGGICAYPGNITLKNSTVTGNMLINTDKGYAAGIYLLEQSTLIIGGPGVEEDTSKVTGNLTSDDKPSNVRLPESNGKNETTSISVVSDLAEACEIRVVNPKVMYSQFGSTDEAHADLDCLLPTSTAKNIIADDNSLFGRLDMSGEGRHTVIVWWGDPVCKITNSEGTLLYLNGSDMPAVYMSIQEAYSDYTTKAFVDKSTEEPDNVPAQIQMLVETCPITSKIVFDKDYAVILTTAAPGDSLFDYPRTATNPRSTLIRGSAMKDNIFHISGNTAEKPVQIKNLIVDGDNVTVNETNGNSNDRQASLFVVAGNLILTDGAELKGGNTLTKNGRGGAIYIVTNGKVLMNGSSSTNYSSIHNCIGRSAGAVYIANGAEFTMDGYARIYECEARKVNGNNFGGSGGAVTVGRNDIKGTFIQKGNSLIQNCIAEVSGGAVSVEKASTYRIEGNAGIKGCSANTAGGIYLVEGTTLEISGNPDFGGSGVVNGALDFTGANYARGINYNNKKNGDLAYPVINDGTSSYARPRQDIFIAGYDKDDVAAQIKVTGEITSGDGTIWVWAEKSRHYEVDKQFAQFKLDNGVTLNGSQKKSSMSAFRNAVCDADTHNPLNSQTIKYLFGVAGSGNNIIWGNFVDGSRKVILRKVAKGSYNALSGAEFEFDGAGWPGMYDDQGNPVQKLTSLSSGVFYIGVMNYGTYFFKETGVPTNTNYSGNAGKWFCLIVDETGFYVSKGHNEQTNDELNRKAAQDEAEALIPKN